MGQQEGLILSFSLLEPVFDLQVHESTRATFFSHKHIMKVSHPHFTQYEDNRSVLQSFEEAMQRSCLLYTSTITSSSFKLRSLWSNLTLAPVSQTLGLLP